MKIDSDEIRRINTIYFTSDKILYTYIIYIPVNISDLLWNNIYLNICYFLFDLYIFLGVSILFYSNYYIFF